MDADHNRAELHVSSETRRRSRSVRLLAHLARRRADRHAGAHLRRTPRMGAERRSSRSSRSARGVCDCLVNLARRELIDMRGAHRRAPAHGRRSTSVPVRTRIRGVDDGRRAAENARRFRAVPSPERHGISGFFYEEAAIKRGTLADLCGRTPRRVLRACGRSSASPSGPFECRAAGVQRERFGAITAVGARIAADRLQRQPPCLTRMTSRSRRRSRAPFATCRRRPCAT
jgi:hypothetical protein